MEFSEEIGGHKKTVVEKNIYRMILFESFKHIESICKKYGIENYTVNNNGLVDVKYGVNLSNRRLDKFPLNFGTVTGIFFCPNNKLRTLEGSPREVGGTFDCSNNLLTTLEGSPIKVSDFNCSNNQLTTLEGSPKEVIGDFICYNNQLRSLEGCPTEVRGVFNCNNNQLTSLEGSPTSLGGDFYCSDNQLTTLEGSPTEVRGYFYCNNNKLRTLKGISERIDGLVIGGNPISNISRLFKNTKQFLELLNDYNFIYNDKIIKARFEQACLDAGIEMPKTIKDYFIV
jgi:hypothetical protein